MARPAQRVNARRVRAAAVLAVSVSAASLGVDAQTLRNWFDDPFFALSSAFPGCPEPAGPRVGEADRQLQSHRRAEKGTTCWLARECDRPNAYAYDRDIAQAIESAVHERARFPDSSLWVTVQGRVVYVEGCVAHESQAAEIEAFMAGLPHVQQAIAIVTTRPAARLPYKPFAPR